MSRKSEPAAYVAIAEAIRSEIGAKRLNPHTRLASEPELAASHGVARETVRRALALLADEGLIYTRRGAGSYVAEPRVEQELDHLFSFTEFMEHRGLRPGAKVLESGVLQITDPASPVLHTLKLKPGSSVIHLRRLRLAAGEPLVIASTWLPAQLFRGFLKYDLRRYSVYEIMSKMGHKPADAAQSIESVALAENEARLLNLPAGAPALLIRRVAFSHGTPVEYAVDYYRGDRTRFHVRLGVLQHHLRSGAPGLL